MGAPSPSAPAGPRSRALPIALFTIFLDILGFGLIIPIQPFYAESFGASATVVTLLSATFSAMQFLAAPFWGRLSDRVGRRPIILVSVAVGMLGHVLFATAGSLPMLFVARLVTGLGTANFGAAQAVVADTTSGHDRARGMGLLGAAFGMGFIIGPAVGGALAQLSPEAPFWFGAALSAVNLAFAFWALPETLPPERRGRDRRPGRFIAVLDAGAARAYPNVPKLLAITALAVTGMGLMEQSMALLVERVWVLPEHGGVASAITHKQSAAMTAVVLVVVGLASAIVQGGFLGRLTRRYGERALVRAGAALATVALGLIPVAAIVGSYPLLVAVGGGVLAAGTALLYPSTNAFVSRSVPATEQGRWLGIGQSLSALGRTLGPALAGVLFSAHALLPFGVAAALTLVAVAVAFALRPLQASEPKPTD